MRPTDRSAIPFLDDARRNLAVVRRSFGMHSPVYRRLRRHYRRVADLLGLRRAFERSLHRLRRRAPKPPGGSAPTAHSHT